MLDREQYTPGPANIARIQKDRGQNGEEKWTLVLVRELRHSPEKVWEAITDPAHLREWAPFVRRWEPGYGWSHGETHHGGSAHAARYRNNRDASRRSQPA